MHRAAGSALVVLSTALLAGCTSGTTTTPVASPPPSTALGAASSPAASGPTTVAMGTFHRVDADATGTVALEHLADRSFAIVFEEFSITSAEHTNVILVSNTDVTKDADIDQTKIVDLGPLTGTAGMQDYKVPAAMTAGAMGYHTVVLWDTAMKHAIAAASLALK
jgi:electron transfer DM13